jgi:hypothetical protein
MLTRHSAPIIFFRVRSATPIGAGCIGAPIALAEYKEDDCVWCASPIFIPNAYKLSFSHRKWKYVAENTTGPSKRKQTSITTVRYPILSVARLPTPLIFRYPLPLTSDFVKEIWVRLMCSCATSASSQLVSCMER